MAHPIESAVRAWGILHRWNVRDSRDKKKIGSLVKLGHWQDSRWLKQDFSSPGERERLTKKYKAARDKYHDLKSKVEELECEQEEARWKCQKIEEELRQAGMSEKEIRRAWIYH